VWEDGVCVCGGEVRVRARGRGDVHISSTSVLMLALVLVSVCACCLYACRNAKKSSDLGELSAYLTQVGPDWGGGRWRWGRGVERQEEGLEEEEDEDAVRGKGEDRGGQQAKPSGTCQPIVHS